MAGARAAGGAAGRSPRPRAAVGLQVTGTGVGTAVVVLAEVATRRVPARARSPAHPPPVRLVAPAEYRVVVRPWERMHLQQIVPLHPTVPDALAASWTGGSPRRRRGPAGRRT